MNEGAMSTGENILTKTYDLLLYAIPQLNKFPRSHKFLITLAPTEELSQIKAQSGLLGWVQRPLF